jgi:cytochrome c5
MSKYLIALAIAGAMSVSAAAQTQQNVPATNQAQQAKPQMIKKRVCEDNDNPYSRIMRVCHTIEVPAPHGDNSANNQVAPQADPQANRGTK